MSSYVKYIYYPLISITFLVAIVAWAVVGFLFWIPFLARMTGLFVYAVTNSAFTGSSLIAASESLGFAITFWIRGFQLIYDIMQDMLSRPGGSQATSLQKIQKIQVRWQNILPEVFLMIFWWVLTGLIWQGFVHGWWQSLWRWVSAILS